jgi:phosphonate transport system ATP-binding protein
VAAAADVAAVHIAVMPPDYAMPPWVTARGVLALYKEADDEEQHRAVWLGQKLWGRVGRMSGGERQAVSLAACLGPSAEVLMLDEPFAHLDFTRRIAAIELLRERAPGRLLTLISSQNAADLVTLCNWYLVLRDGRAVFTGSLAELLTEDTAAEDRLSAVEKRLLGLLGGSPESVNAIG